MATSADVTVATRVPPPFRAELEADVAAIAASGRTVDGHNGPRPFRLSDGFREALELWHEVKRGGMVAITLEEFDRLRTRSGELERVQAAGPAPAPADTRDRAHRGDDRSMEAARQARPRAGTQRAELLQAIARAGTDGMTADEAIASVNRRRGVEGRPELAVNGAARRVTDLRQSGAIKPLLDDDGLERSRQTQHGVQATVWTLTEKGNEWLEELNA